jgi:hypothetical protein
MNMIDAVLARPTMYTMSGSYGEVIAFLEGYVSGVAKTRPYVDIVVEWSSFKEWLTIHEGVSQEQTFRLVRDRYGSEQEAIACIKQLYDDFKAATHTLS